MEPAVTQQSQEQFHEASCYTADIQDMIAHLPPDQIVDGGRIIESSKRWPIFWQVPVVDRHTRAAKRIFDTIILPNQQVWHDVIWICTYLIIVSDMAHVMTSCVRMGYIFGIIVICYSERSERVFLILTLLESRFSYSEGYISQFS